MYAFCIHLSIMDDARTANLLGALALALSDRQEEAVRAASDLGPSAAGLMVTLGQYPGDNIGIVSQVLGLTHSVAVRLVGSLVDAGLVERMPGTDRREVRLRLTGKGKRTRAAILIARDAALRESLSSLSASERERLGALAAKLLQALTTSRWACDHICRLCDEDACGGDDCPVERQAQSLEGGRR
jgi:DNA-binding MarR family transcriptional regulator